MSNDLMREQFEIWASGKFAMSIETIQHCRYELSYANTLLHVSWSGWQASREAVMVQLPDVGAGLTDQDLLIVAKGTASDFIEAIEAQGLKVKS